MWRIECLAGIFLEYPGSEAGAPRPPDAVVHAWNVIGEQEGYRVA
jgi:hypothetical protein